MRIHAYIKQKLENFWLQLKVIKLYYRKSPRFALADLLLGLSTLFYNPYALCRKQKMIYGETPIPTLHRILEFLPITADDVWLELGSGRGKSAFWISQFVGCATIGVEKVPLFAKIAEKIQKLLHIPNLRFYAADQMSAPFSKATIVYFYSTTTSAPRIKALMEKMRDLPENAYLITISAKPPESPYFEAAGHFPASFPWGETEVYLTRKTATS